MRLSKRPSESRRSAECGDATPYISLPLPSHTSAIHPTAAAHYIVGLVHITARIDDQLEAPLMSGEVRGMFSSLSKYCPSFGLKDRRGHEGELTRLSSKDVATVASLTRIETALGWIG